MPVAMVERKKHNAGQLCKGAPVVPLPGGGGPPWVSAAALRGKFGEAAVLRHH